MGIAVITFLFALALGIYWKLGFGAGGRRRTAPRRTARAAQRPFACVAVQFGREGCDAVKRLTGIRFLRNAAPIIPLQECDCAYCQCVYLHYDDRRQFERREAFPRTDGFWPNNRRINRVDRRRNQLSA